MITKMRMLPANPAPAAHGYGQKLCSYCGHEVEPWDPYAVAPSEFSSARRRRGARPEAVQRLLELYRREGMTGEPGDLTPAQEIARELAFTAQMAELRASIGARYGRR